MSDLNKDIEILKEIQGIFEHFKNHGWVNDLKREVDIDKVIPAIENILSEFEGLRDFSTETVRRSAELQVELETYKKIVGEIIEETANGMKYLYVDTSVKDEGKYEAYMDIRNVLEKYKIID